MADYSDVLVRALRLLNDASSLEEITTIFGNLKWRTYPSPQGEGRTSFAVIGGNKKTGEIHVLAVIENCAAPEHEHTAGGQYGELIITIAGELEDVTDAGEPILLRPGMHLVHGGGTRHQPRAKFWFGYYHQPRGSTLVSS